MIKFYITCKPSFHCIILVMCTQFLKELQLKIKKIRRKILKALRCALICISFMAMIIVAIC